MYCFKKYKRGVFYIYKLQMSLGCCVSLVSGTILVGPTCRPGGPWGRRRLQESGRPASHQIFFHPCLCLPAASVSLPASQARPDQPPPWRSLPAPSSAAPPAPRVPTSRSPPPPPRRSGSPAAAAGLSRFASPPLQVWSTQMSFLLLPRDWNR